MRKYLATLGAALALTVTSPATAAAILQIDSGGKLTGATGVDVGGTLYDVTFVDGTCAQIFGGCDAVTDFQFQTVSTASAAAQALLDQVFLNGADGNFDSHPESVFGCNGPCNSWIPYALPSDGIYYSARVATNTATSDQIAPGDFAASFNTGFHGGSNFAWFTLASVSAVPEPSTWAMMLLGFGAVGFAMRRSRRRSLLQLA